MNNASGHFAILAAAGVAAVLLSVLTAVGRYTEASAPDEAAVVVTLPQRPSAPAPRPATKPQPATVAIPGDRASLVRALQSELKRVGCYDGDVSGAWNAPSRAAMKAFTERVNATLPVDNPDQILLALVQGHRGRACGTRDGEKPAPPQTAAAETGEPKPMPKPRIVAPPVLVTRKPAPPPAEPRPPAAAAVPPLPQTPAPATPIAPSNPPRHDVDQGGPVPAVGVYERRPHRTHRNAPPKPVIYARSLLRKLQRAAQSVW